MSRALVLAFLLLLIPLSGCKEVEGDGRPFTGFSDPGFRLAATTDLSEAGKNGVPDLSELLTFDLNWAVPGSEPTLSQKFYIVGTVEGEPVVIRNISLSGRNPEDFSIVGVELPLTLNLGEYIAFQVQFAPRTEGGNREAVVDVSSERGSLSALRVQGNAERESGEVSIWRGDFEQFNLANVGKGSVAMASAAMAPPEQAGHCPAPFDPTIPLQIKNFGLGTLVIRRGDILKDEKSVFEWDSTVTFPIQIPPQSSVIAKVRLKESAPELNSFWAHVEFHSLDSNEPVYRFGISIYKPETKPCLEMIAHEAGTEVGLPPSGLQFEYAVGEVDSEKEVNITLYNGGGRSLTVNASDFLLEGGHGGVPCSGGEVEFDLGSQEITLAPGQAHTAQLQITGLSDCPEQLNGMRMGFFSQLTYTTEDSGNFNPQIRFQGDFIAASSSQTKVKVTLRTTGVEIGNGDTLQVLFPQDLVISSKDPISLVGVQMGEQVYRVDTPNLPFQILENRPANIRITPSARSEAPVTITFIFSDTSTFLINATQ